MRVKVVGSIIVGLLCASVLPTVAVPVLEYSFPASYDGGSTLVFTDLSTAGNNGIVTPGTGGGIKDDRPAGFDAALMSLSANGGGHGKTDAIDLLNNTAVAANGGFTMDVWFKWAGKYTNTRKLIDYAGTESLRTINSQIQFVLSNGGTIIGYDIVAEQWYHAVAVFDTTGNSAVEDPNYPGEYTVTGTARLFIDDVLVASAENSTKSSFGDRLNRSIGINMWPNGGDYNQGKIFNPTVSLGIPVVDPTPPKWIQDPFECVTGIVGVAYSDTLANKAYDPNGDPVTFSLIDTGTWLDVAADGTLTNNRALVAGDIGLQSFQVVASDGITGSTTGTLNIVVRDTLSPVWGEDPINGGTSRAGVEYVGTLDGAATDPDGGTIAYSKSDGPAWLVVATDGTLSGTPAVSDIGENTFTVVADDGFDPVTSATLHIRIREDLRSISINFIENDGNQGFVGGQDIGPLQTDSANWNNTKNRDSGTKSDGTQLALMDDTGANVGASVAWSASGVNWNGDGTTSDEARLSVGYLEDGDPGVSITVSNIPYAQYRVYGLLSTHQNNTGLYEARNCYVNGDLVFGGTESTTASAYGGIKANNNNNGESWTEIMSGSVTGNYWMVETSGSILSITGLPQSSAQRGSISGLIIENLTYSPGGPVSDLMIANLDADNVVLSWTGEDGKSYSVETNSNLIISGWNTFVAGILGDGGFITVTNAIGPSETFYRVISE